jgi:cutinase
MLFKLSIGALLPFFLGTLASPLPVPADPSSLLIERNAPLNQFLSVLVDYLPAINETLSDASNVITDLDTVLADFLGLQTTYNQLGSGSCTAYTVLFARGTSESGNVGVLVGPPLFMALQSLMKPSDLTIQGVNNYAANIEGYLAGGDPAGSAEM